MTKDHKPGPPDTIGPTAFHVTRRGLLGGTALAIVTLTLPSGALAQTPPAEGERAFHTFSIALTGRNDLSPVTSKRIFDALRQEREIGAERLLALTGLADANRSPEALKAAAGTRGLGSELMRVLTAWYTGTVDTVSGPVVVAYRDALMYQPVADGMTVPTYCNKGPMWWTGLPPEIARMPANNPRVL
jgi:hypothetical protein